MHIDAHRIARIVYLLQPVLLLVAVGAWAVGMYGQNSAMRSRKRGDPRPVSARFAIGMLVFLSIIGFGFLMDGYVQSAVLDEISPKLNSRVESVTVNGVKVEKPSDLLAELRKVHHIDAHHSNPTVPYRVLLSTAQGPLQLDLRRDSEDPHEYWVFYSDPHPVTRNEIGRISTTALDGF